MGGDFSIVGRIKLAFQVMSRWETLVTLGAFIALWLIVRYVADPWRGDERRRERRSFRLPKKAKEAPAASTEEIDDDDVLPD
jgi:hypothetical protein